MSSIFQDLLTAGGRIKTGPGPITSYFRSLPLNALQEVVVGAGPIVNFTHGIPINAAGAVVGSETVGPATYGSGATPYGPNGELEFAPLASPVSFFYQGVPYTADGLYAPSSAIANALIVKDFSMTPGQISPLSYGYRTSTPIGSITPDNIYGGDTVVLIQATDLDVIRVQPAGGVRFPATSGNLSVAFGIYQGPTRMLLAWNAISLWYEAAVPGIYAYMIQQLGVGTNLRLSAAPA